ncbi:hypothetical protein Mal64_00260 [Pseudobythopirellula maris]|uniref:Uncharacterized protein n=1 Tax=Pseudobythopirellula maris TaxID=2527991 RepID=A0A5C5ZQ90_9BACT|nr:hypothetical protein [Pseudobythopirellula maris]TWT89649.1 hypothetical protein Mal64_00260 [Pseudobythopirellula maris]
MKKRLMPQQILQPSRRGLTVGMLFLGGAFLFAADAQAVGRWNLPTSSNQWWGFGYGPGYHAPMVLGPSYKAKVAGQGVERMQTPMSPPAHAPSRVFYGNQSGYGGAADFGPTLGVIESPPAYHQAPAYGRPLSYGVAPPQAAATLAEPVATPPGN